MRFRHIRVSGFSGAFTLIELLMVMGIMALMMALVVPVTSSMMQNNDLGRAGQLVADQIRLARQIASAKNRSVEVRLIKTQGNDDGFTAVQLIQWNPRKPASASVGVTTADPIPITRLISLPAGAAISENSSLSKILTMCTDGKMDAGAKKNADYRSFQIKPSGLLSSGTNTMSNIFLTIAPSRRASAAELPANYVTIQINPNTGSPLVFRP